MASQSKIAVIVLEWNVVGANPICSTIRLRYVIHLTPRHHDKTIVFCDSFVGSFAIAVTATPIFFVRLTTAAPNPAAKSISIHAPIPESRSTEGRSPRKADYIHVVVYRRHLQTKATTSSCCCVFKTKNYTHPKEKSQLTSEVPWFENELSRKSSWNDC